MTRLSWMRWISVVALMSAGCTTVTPLQTASTVKPDVWRVGLQGSVTPACSVTNPTEMYGVIGGSGGNPFAHCMVAPRGVPTPELRVQARRGLTENSDLGFSVHGSTVLPIGLLIGGTADYRRELWSRFIGPENRQIVSVGPTLGLAVAQVSSYTTVNSRPQLQGDLMLPAYFGHQTDTIEFVVSPRFVERLSLVGTRNGTGTEFFDAGYVGLSLGMFRRDALQFGLGLDYFAPTGMLASGTFTLTAGIAYDFLPAKSE